MLQCKELDRLYEAHTLLPITYSSIYGTEHFYSNTFQLLMWILMPNFPESHRQAQSLFNVLDKDSKTPPSPRHTVGALLLKWGLSLKNSFDKLAMALAWELVCSQTETFCIYFLIPEKLTSVHAGKTHYFVVLRRIPTILETCSPWKVISWLRGEENCAQVNGKAPGNATVTRLRPPRLNLGKVSQLLLSEISDNK